MGYLNVPFFSIFVPFHFHLINYGCTSLHNMFMVLLIFALGNFKIGATKPIFFYSGSLREEGGVVRAWACICHRVKFPVVKK